jgi:hypothetical protein
MNSNQDNEPLGEIADNGQPSVLNALALEGTRNVMRRFNRNTMLVATGLLGTVVFAALVLAVQEHHPLPSEIAGLSGKSTDKISSDQLLRGMFICKTCAEAAATPPAFLDS